MKHGKQPKTRVGYDETSGTKSSNRVTMSLPFQSASPCFGVPEDMTDFVCIIRILASRRRRIRTDTTYLALTLTKDMPLGPLSLLPTPVTANK